MNASRPSTERPPENPPRPAVASSSTLVPRSVIILLHAAIIGTGLFLLFASYDNEQAEMRTALLNRTQRAAESINPSLIRSLTGSESDRGNPAYEEIRRQLAQHQLIYPDLRFTYLMGRRTDGTVVILADDEPEDSPDHSPPGDVYAEANQDEQAVFDHGIAMVLGPTPDRWGVFVTGYVPVFDPSGKQVLALFGMDIDASTWHRTLILKTLPLALVFVLLLVAIATFSLLFRRRSRGALNVPWSTRLEVVAVITTGLLLTSFLCLYLLRFEQRQVRLKFDQLATSESDMLAERIRNIRDNHLVSVRRYIESSHHVTEQEFITFTSGLLDDPMITRWIWLPASPESVGDRPPALSNPPQTAADTELRRDTDHPAHRAAIERAAGHGLAHGTLPDPEINTHPHRMFVYDRSAGGLKGFIRLDLDLNGINPRPNSLSGIHHHVSVLRGRDAPLTLDHIDRSGDAMLEVIRPVSAFGHTFLIASHQPARTLGNTATITPMLAAVAGGSITSAIAFMIGAPLRRKEELQRLVDEQTNAIREREQKFRMIAESMRDVVWSVDVEQWVYTYISPSIKRIGGYSAQEMMDKPPDFTLVESQREHLINQLKTRVTDFVAGRIGPENYFIDEILQRHRNGQVFWTEVVTSFTRNPLNGRLEIRGPTRDITERRQAEIALEENRRFLSGLVENSGALIFVKNREGLYTLANQRWEAVTGISRERTLGRRDADLFPPDLASHFAMGDQQVFQTGAICEQEESMAFTGETRWFFTIKFPLRDEQGTITGVCGISTDITAIKGNQERLRANMEELQRWQDVMLDREGRILELKREVNRWSKEAGKPPVYEHI